MILVTQRFFLSDDTSSYEAQKHPKLFHLKTNKNGINLEIKKSKNSKGLHFYHRSTSVRRSTTVFVSQASPSLQKQKDVNQLSAECTS